jgi:hypothetical protein
MRIPDKIIYYEDKPVGFIDKAGEEHKLDEDWKEKHKYKYMINRLVRKDNGTWDQKEPQDPVSSGHPLGPKAKKLFKPSDFLDIEAKADPKGVLRTRAPRTVGDEEKLMSLLKETLDEVKAKNPDLEIDPRFKTWPRVEKHILKLAKAYMSRGGYSKVELKANEVRMAPMLLKILMQRKTKKHPNKVRYIMNKAELLEKNPSHPDWKEWAAKQNTGTNRAAASEVNQLIALKLIDPLTTCPYHTRVSRKEGVIGPKQVVETPNLDARLYAVEKKNGKPQFRIASFCSLCHHPKNIIISQKKLKQKFGGGFMDEWKNIGII